MAPDKMYYGGSVSHWRGQRGTRSHYTTIRYLFVYYFFETCYLFFQSARNVNGIILINTSDLNPFILYI